MNPEAGEHFCFPEKELLIRAEIKPMANLNSIGVKSIDKSA